MGRNNQFLRKSTQAVEKICGQPGFSGEVNVRMKVSNGVIQTGHVEKSSRTSVKSNVTIIEKTKLD